jgi:type IX secretion system PorP/SprF family membrane protein
VKFPYPIIPKTVKNPNAMKKIILPILILFAFALSIVNLQAQDETIYGHYHVNPILINPGANGFSDRYHRIFFNFRSQWTGIAGAPNSYSISYNGPINNQLGVGVAFFGEDIAQISRQRGQAAFSYRFQAEDFKISAGFSGEFHRFRVDPSVRNDPFYEQNDEVLEEHINGISEFDASVGLYATFKENTFFGVALPSIVGSRLDEIGNTSATSTSFLSYYTFFVGHRFGSDGDSDADIWVEPSLMLRKVRQAPFLGDANLKVGFLGGKLITGLTYRFGHDGGFAALLGTQYSTLQIYYSYDIYFGDFQDYNSGTHEITLGIDIERKEGKFDRARKFRK